MNWYLINYRDFAFTECYGGHIKVDEMDGTCGTH
jgi:hypothetical protein